MIKDYYVGIKQRLIDSIIHTKIDETTRRLALLFARISHGFHVTEFIIHNSEIEALHFNTDHLSVLLEKINTIGWFKIEYTTGKTGIVKVNTTPLSEMYRDGVPQYINDLTKEIGLRSQREWQKAQY